MLVMARLNHLHPHSLALLPLQPQRPRRHSIQLLGIHNNQMHTITSSLRLHKECKPTVLMRGDVPVLLQIHRILPMKLTTAQLLGLTHRLYCNSLRNNPVNRRTEAAVIVNPPRVFIYTLQCSDKVDYGSYTNETSSKRRP
jgi:hypothetical protein